MLANYAKEFKAFIMRGNVVDLAVGIIIGGAFGQIVDALVKGIFMPVINVFLGLIDFSNARIDLKYAVLDIGLVIQAVINFVIIGFCLFSVVKAMNRLSKKEEAKPAEPTASEKLLMEIRDRLPAKV